MLSKLYARLSKLQDFSLLILRLILAIGFYEPMLYKIRDISSVEIYLSGLGIPASLFSAYLVTGTELLIVVLLPLGLFSRIISVATIISMIVAIITVHWDNGFAAGQNGYEIPLYFITMLFVVIVFGSGKYSLDNLLQKNKIIS